MYQCHMLQSPSRAEDRQLPYPDWVQWFQLVTRLFHRNHHVSLHSDKQKAPIVILRRSRRISCTGASVSEPFYARSFAARSG